MSRSNWKGYFVNHKLYYNFFLKKKLYSNNYNFVIPKFLNHSFIVYNGKNFLNIFVTKNMLKKKMGIFVRTKKSITHITKKK